MQWKQPPTIKSYEALGAVADGRLEINGNTGKCYSSSGNKFYTITYDPVQLAIMVNDNGSYWKGYLGYPAIAFLLEKGELEYKEDFGELLKGIPWKDINTKFKNDFDTTLEHILQSFSADERAALAAYIVTLAEELKEKNLTHLGKKVKPPAGY